MPFSTVQRAIETAGLAVRGAFHPTPADGVPEVRPGQATVTLVLVGMSGRAQWPAFRGSPESADGQPNPLDRWSHRLLEDLADAFDAFPLEPFGGPPWWPFQRWAVRAESLHVSPLGLLIHAEHGLWHSYRGALAFAEALDLPARQDSASPCDTCATRPCLHACPVSAHASGGFAPASCANYLRTPAGEDCLTGACAARRACPIGQHHLQGPDQARFHLSAFVRSTPA